jgi:hypothetical protein
MYRMEGRSVRILKGRIDSMLYERTAISRKPEELVRKKLATLKRSGEVGPALVLPPQDVLERRLQDAITAARLRSETNL